MMIGLKKLLVGLMILALLSLLSGCQIKAKLTEDYNKYNINVYYEPEECAIFGSQVLTYKNTEDTALKELYFHLYSNMFRKQDTSPMLGSLDDNYPYGFNPGQIDIINISVDNEDVFWRLEGSGNSLLYISLNKPVDVKNTIEVKIDFQEKLPKARTDFGSFNGVSSFENWYPILCVYDDEGWHKEPMCKVGESNFSEISNYNIEINLPEDEVVASSGKCIKTKKLDSGRKTIILQGNKMRDFAWISSSKFKLVEKKADGVIIRSYFLNEDKTKGVEALDFGGRAIKFFSDTFGKYPYDYISIVETPLYGGAMEYPLLTAIGEQFYTEGDSKMLEGAVAHEIAHQWWYVVVGNNEYRNPWLDEALATYSEAMYYEKYYGKEMLEDRVDFRIGNTRFDREPGDSVDRFKSSSEYNMVVYIKGAYMLDQFRKKVGDDLFLEVMKEYYLNNKFKNAQTADFLDVVRKVCGNEAVGFIKLGLSGA